MGRARENIKRAPGKVGENIRNCLGWKWKAQAKYITWMGGNGIG